MWWEEYACISAQVYVTLLSRLSTSARGPVCRLVRHSRSMMSAGVAAVQWRPLPGGSASGLHTLISGCVQRSGSKKSPVKTYGIWSPSNILLDFNWILERWGIMDAQFDQSSENRQIPIIVHFPKLKSHIDTPNLMTDYTSWMTVMIPAWKVIPPSLPFASASLCCTHPLAHCSTPSITLVLVGLSPR